MEFSEIVSSISGDKTYRFWYIGRSQISTVQYKKIPEIDSSTEGDIIYRLYYIARSQRLALL